MAKSSTGGKKNKSIVELKFVVVKLQRILLLGRKLNSDYGEGSTRVPRDVKRGHFAVIATKGVEVKRFVVALSYLKHPRFLELLEQAAEEYGFDREGTLTIPCAPSELKKILDANNVSRKGKVLPSSSAALVLTGRCNCEVIS